MRDELSGPSVTWLATSRQRRWVSSRFQRGGAVARDYVACSQRFEKYERL